MSRKRRFPDFAGMALVDILANGAAMLLIVIVLSIAGRMEREETQTEQVREVTSVMSRRFATSLVLNELAASRPAVLHDYENSKIDAILDPAVMPILELHRDYAREFYSGAIWTRPLLLKQPNAVDLWLESIPPETRKRIRLDVYDISQFYLVTSILRDHGVIPRHWHFLSGARLSAENAALCPPGVASKDCQIMPADGGDSPFELPAAALSSPRADSADRWFPDGDGTGSGGRGFLPGGAVAGQPGVGLGGGFGSGSGSGSGSIGGSGMSGSESFPDSRAGKMDFRGELSEAERTGNGSSGGLVRVRLAAPESLEPEDDSISIKENAPLEKEVLLGALLRFTSELQSVVDEGRSPTVKISGLRSRITRLISDPPPLTGEERRIVKRVAWERETMARLLDGQLPGDPFVILHETVESGSALAVKPNRMLSHSTVVAGTGQDSGIRGLAEARPALNLNSHPDIWRGLRVPLRWGSVLLVPPVQRLPQTPRWRAVAYVAPEFNDFVVGFVYSSVDSAGRLLVATDNNRARLDGHFLTVPRLAPVFGVRALMLVLYGFLGLGLLAPLLRLMFPGRIRSGMAVFALCALAVVSLAFARQGLVARPPDLIEVNPDFRPSPSMKARILDGFVAEHLTTLRTDGELRKRLARPPGFADIDSFRVDVCEVTQKDFEQFARWSRANFPERVGENDLTTSSAGQRIAGLLKSPASGVNYAGAAAYCKAAGGRLPWAEEWEAAASGFEGRLYAWGSEWNKDPWPYADPDRNAAQVCGTHPAASSPEGLHDLNGNVMEWSRGRRGLSAAFRQPGAHGAPAVRVRARRLYALNSAWLEMKNPGTKSNHLGFRCVYDTVPPLLTFWGASVRQIEIPGGRYPVGPPSDARLPQLAAFLTDIQSSPAGLLKSRGEKNRSVKVSRCEVTRRDYGRFLKNQLTRSGFFANENEPRDTDYTPLDWDRQMENPQLPVTGVNWWAADAYARWAGGRLPTREDWQLAAAGPELLPYPWGRDYDPRAAVTGDLDGYGPLACGAAGKDRNAAGINDLAGGVSEWTRSVAVEGGELAMWAQGGNWILPGEKAATVFSGRLLPLDYRSSGLGFRVFYD